MTLKLLMNYSYRLMSSGMLEMVFMMAALQVFRYKE